MNLLKNIGQNMFHLNSRYIQKIDDSNSLTLWRYYMCLDKKSRVYRFIHRFGFFLDRELMFATTLLFNFLDTPQVEWYIGELTKAPNQHKAKHHFKRMSHALFVILRDTRLVDLDRVNWSGEVDKTTARLLAEVLAKQVGSYSIAGYTEMIHFSIQRRRRNTR